MSFEQRGKKGPAVRQEGQLAVIYVLYPTVDVPGARATCMYRAAGGLEEPGSSPPGAQLPMDIQANFRIAHFP